MVRLFLLFTVALVPIALAAQDASVRDPIVVTEAARQIHEANPIVDGHNDLPWALRKIGGGFSKTDIATSQPTLHTDIARLKTGGVGAQFWSVYVPVSTMKDGSALSATLEQIELVHEMCERYPESFALALTTKDVDRIRGEGKIASMIGVEGGHSIENSLSVLRQLYAKGARYMTLTHSESLDWADSCSGDSKCDGLSEFGEEVVREMNRLGMLVDLSHVSDDCMRDALKVTKAPVIFSHSSARGIANHVRNVPDDVLKLTRDNGGVVMVNFYNDFVNPGDAMRSSEKTAIRNGLRAKYPDDEEKVDGELKRWETTHPRSRNCTVHDVLDHIDHIVKIAGIDHVGIGSDFDGIPAVPKQLEDVSTYPAITQGMLDRGYKPDDIRKVLGENVMRVFRAAESLAAK